MRSNGTSRVPYGLGVGMGKRALNEPYFRVADARCGGKRGRIETPNRGPDVLHLSSKAGLVEPILIPDHERSTYQWERQATYPDTGAWRYQVKAQGWYRDPYRVHEDRYFSDGQPTKLVRDGSTECYDAPPPGPPQMELVEVAASQPADGSDLRRADDYSAAPAVNDKNAAFWAALDSVAVYAPMY